MKKQLLITLLLAAPQMQAMHMNDGHKTEKKAHSCAETCCCITKGLCGVAAVLAVMYAGLRPNQSQSNDFWGDALTQEERSLVFRHGPLTEQWEEPTKNMVRNCQELFNAVPDDLAVWNGLAEYVKEHGDDVDMSSVRDMSEVLQFRADTRNVCKILFDEIEQNKKNQ